MSLASAVVGRQAARAVANFEANDVLGWMGLTRQRSHFWEKLALVGVGAVVGATGALLFAPESGRKTRRRIGKELNRLGEEAGAKLREAKDQLPLINGQVQREKESAALEESAR
jgi:hypothetical protein